MIGTMILFVGMVLMISIVAKVIDKERREREKGIANLMAVIVNEREQRMHDTNSLNGEILNINGKLR